MLIVFDAHNRILPFASYKGLCSHFESLERHKGKGKWVFARHSWERMMSCYKYVCIQKFSSSLREKFEQHLEFEQGLEKALRREPEETGKGRSSQEPDILEIIKGDSRKAIFIPITPDINVDALRQEWCIAYSKSHNCSLFDVSSPADFKKTGGQDHETIKEERLAEIKRVDPFMNTGTPENRGGSL